jgi:hypothetical protein
MAQLAQKGQFARPAEKIDIDRTTRRAEAVAASVS